MIVPVAANAFSWALLPRRLRVQVLTITMRSRLSWFAKEPCRLAIVIPAFQACYDTSYLCLFEAHWGICSTNRTGATVNAGAEQSRKI